MSRVALAAAFAVAAMAVAPVAVAHHAVQGTVNTEVSVQTAATLIKVDWINPHTWLHFDVAMPDGKQLHDVMVESMGTTALHQAGMDEDVLDLGATYDVTYFPNRDGSAGGFLTRLVLPDGRIYDIKNRGKLVGPEG